MASTVQALNFFQGTETRPTTGTMPNRQIWEYVRHIYYSSVQNSVPELHMMYLLGSMQDTTIVRGIERIRILFAVDTSLVPDGIPDAYVASNNVTQTQWNERRVLGARIFVLVRAIRSSNDYTNNNTYTLGDLAAYTPNDHYRRLLLQSTVMFNSIGDLTP